MFLKTESLKKVIEERPELPIVFFCHESIWSEARIEDWEFWSADTMTVRIGKVFEGNVLDTLDGIFTDENEDIFEQALRDEMEMWDETEGMSDEEFDKAVEKEIERSQSDWKECIIVKLGV